MIERNRRLSFLIGVAGLLIFLFASGVRLLSPSKSLNFPPVVRAENMPIETGEEGEMCLPNPISASLQGCYSSCIAGHHRR